MGVGEKVWVTFILIAVVAHFTILITSGRPSCEVAIEEAYIQGYTQYQIDEYLPKPNHKVPNPKLKEKVNG